MTSGAPSKAGGLSGGKAEGGGGNRSLRAVIAASALEDPPRARRTQETRRPRESVQLCKRPSSKRTAAGWKAKRMAEAPLGAGISQDRSAEASTMARASAVLPAPAAP
jgi:hypothetical protein